MNRYYRKKDNVLVYIGSNANQDFWDNQWKEVNDKQKINFSKNSYVSDITKRYLKPESKVIEGGCGRGNHVYSLKKNNYQSIGIDYAEQTVKEVSENYPELDIRQGDVRSLELESDSIDGYWSIGVIEHFYEGYSDISREMHRVLRSGGYVFLSFPSMNPLRKIKGKLGLYQDFNENKINDFYQFCLDPDDVIKNFQSLGMIKVKKSFRDGYKGLKDESPQFIKGIMQKIYDSNNFLAKSIRFFISKFLSWFTGHSCLIIFRKS